MRNALHVIAKKVFEDGLFHVDPHRGNIIMIGPEDAPVIGLVGQLSEDMRDGAIRLLIAAATGNARRGRLWCMRRALIQIRGPVRRLKASWALPVGESAPLGCVPCFGNACRHEQHVLA
jgi:predicted unusual protein kinase regulating ubiquinone biosynthesis (AarF/ABC1/UbiB family)